MNESKKICFIEPPIAFLRDQLDPPFPLMYLAAVAEDQGWQAKIVHMETLEDPLPEAQIYAVTSTSPQWPTTLKLSERLAHEFPDKWIICGGAHISACPDDFYDSKFDAVVKGEGEIVLERILKNPDMLRDCKIIMGEPVLNLDTIHFPARHLIDWSKYKRGIELGNGKLSPAVSIITSRGCPFRCIFCSSHCVFGRRVRFRSIDNVIAEIKQVIDTLGYKGFNFHDDTFCVNRARILKMCEEFAKLDIIWRCLTRADTVDRELLKIMRDSGCKLVIIGMESGSQKILETLRKGTTVELNLKAMKMIKEFMQLKVGVIVGSPGETWETINETKKLLKECPPDFWNVSTFMPLPGSEIWNDSEKFDLKILTRDLNEYQMIGKDFKGNVVVETARMSKKDIEQARDELMDFLSNQVARS
jgi:anaerobic magnesium-protoporphyrin IX monomethyl ester cyclase